MILPTHHFRGHIARCTARVFLVLWIPDPCNPKVSHPQVPLSIKDQIFRLDVSMNNALIVHILKSLNDASRKELGLLLTESPMPADVIPEVSSGQQVHNKVEVVFVLKGKLHVHYVAARSENRLTHC